MTGTLQRLSSKAIIGAFFKRLEEKEAKSWTKDLASVYTSTQELETYGFTSDSPTLREKGNNPTKRQLKTFEIVLKNVKYQNILEIEDDDMRRDKTGQIIARVNERASRAAALPQQVLSKLIVNNGLAYDKVALWHPTGHINENGDVINNDIAVNVANTSVLTAQEGVDAVLKAIEQMVGFKDDEGEPRNEDAESFVVMCPTNLHTGLLAATRNEFTGNGASNTLTNSDYKIAVKQNARLTNPSEFLVFRADGDVKTFLWQDEVPAQFSQRDPSNSDKGFEDDVHLFKAKRICAGGYGRYDQTCRVRLT